MTRRKLKVGDELYCVPQYRLGYPRIVTIEKIGRTWATLARSEGRIRLSSWELDSRQFTSSGRCYENEEEYLEYQRRKDARLAFARARAYTTMPEELTLDDLREIAHKLGCGEAFDRELARRVAMRKEKLNR